MDAVVLVDWLSASLPTPLYSSIPQTIWLARSIRRARELLKDSVPRAMWDGPFTEFGGRPPFARRWTCAEKGMSLLMNPGLNYFLLEIMGTGCQLLREAHAMSAVLRASAGYLTRLDLAVDIACDTDPREFVRRRFDTRFATKATFSSRTGVTCYVGSMKSDRFARVYRYKEPLPRSHLLRIEHVFRRTWAPAMARMIAERGAEDAARYCTATWGWEHPVWDVGRMSQLTVIDREVATRHPNSLLWVLNQVIPCLQRLEKEGIIANLREFMEEHCYGPVPEVTNGE